MGVVAASVLSHVYNHLLFCIIFDSQGKKEQYNQLVLSNKEI